MATFSPAEHFYLDSDLGGIATGKCADLVVIPTIDKIDAQSVIIKGRVVAQQERLEIDLIAEHYPVEFSRAVIYCCLDLKMKPLLVEKFFDWQGFGLL